MYYYVITRFPAGLAFPVNGITTARSTAGIGNLSANNYNVVTWNGVSGATGYDVIRQATPGSPTSPCTGCAVVLNTAGTTVNDTGQNGGNYPPLPNLPSVQNVLGQFSIDNLNFLVPRLLYGMTGTPTYYAAMVSGVATAGQAALFNADGTLSGGSLAPPVMNDSGTWATLPPCTVNGSLYLFTDSYYNAALCNGSTYTYLLNGVAMIPPDTVATFSSVNLGSATFDSTHGPGVIVNPTDASFSVKARVTPKPGTATWHVILAYTYTSVPTGGAGNELTGICTRDSLTGKMDLLGMYRDAEGVWGILMTNPTTYSNTQWFSYNSSQPLAHNPMTWLRVGQGSVNQTWDWSPDQGATWINLVTETNNSRFTLDQVGFFTNGNPTSINALHWSVTP